MNVQLLWQEEIKRLRTEVSDLKKQITTLTEKERKNKTDSNSILHVNSLASVPQNSVNGESSVLDETGEGTLLLDDVHSTHNGHVKDNEHHRRYKKEPYGRHRISIQLDDLANVTAV